jgi:dephospho-CoA kinase
MSQSPLELTASPAPVVALIGPVGAGKSVVLGFLAELGAAVINFDDYSRDLLQPGTPETEAVARELGARFLRADGTVDRPALGALVFADDEARARLEAIMHPPMLARLRAAVAEFRRQPAAPLLAVEGALLGRLAAGLFDAMVVVDAPTPVRGQRLEQTRGLSREAVIPLLALHERLATGSGWADFTLVNEGSPADLRAETGKLWQNLTGLPPVWNQP